jgi:hypothetical protein
VVLFSLGRIKQCPTIFSGRSALDLLILSRASDYGNELDNSKKAIAHRTRPNITAT